jgi:hypothetical protein
MTAGPTDVDVTATPLEPSGDIEIYAKRLPIAGKGPRAGVLVEVTFYSEKYLPAVRLHGSLRGKGGFDEVFGIPDSVSTLRRMTVKKVQYLLDLKKGREHHLEFTVSAEPGSGSTARSSAYLRVNLDEDLDPERLNGLVQFRAQMERR